VLLNNQDILNWKFNFNDILGIFADIYDDIQDKTWFINELIDSWFLDKAREMSWRGEKKWRLDIDNVNIWIDLIYSTLESSSEQDVSSTINRTLEEYSLDKLLNIQIFWKDLSQNIVSVLKSINKNDLKNYVNEYSTILNDLISWNIAEDDKAYKYSILATELFKIVDIEKLKSSYMRTDMDPNQRLIIELSWNIQSVIKQKGATFNFLVEKWKDINDIINWKIDINQVNRHSIESYWKQAFDLMNQLISSVWEDYLESFDFWPKKRDKKEKNSILESFIDSFVENNFKFIIKEVFSSIFSWWFNKWRSIDNYFRDIKNRDEFWETLYEFLLNT
jgi:hypothetical protein